MTDDDELGDFEDYGDAPDSSTDPDDGVEQPDDLTGEGVRVIRDGPEENPLALDPRVGVKDLCYDRAKPGAKVYVVASLASSVENYEEEYPDAPALDEYAGNVVTSFTREDAVLACVYVKDSLTSVDTNTTAYPMPESRLTRFPAEEASMVGSSSVEFARTHLPGESDPHRLGGALPGQIPDDAERDEDGGAVFPDDYADAPNGEEIDLERALSVVSTHGYVDEAREVAEDAGVEEEVYGL